MTLKNVLNRKNAKDLRFIYKYMLDKEPHNLTKNQIITIILKPLRKYSMEGSIEMKEIPKEYVITYYCGTCLPKKVVYAQGTKKLTSKEYMKEKKEGKVLTLSGIQNYCSKCKSQSMYMEIEPKTK